MSAGMSTVNKTILSDAKFGIEFVLIPVFDFRKLFSHAFNMSTRQRGEVALFRGKLRSCSFFLHYMPA